jgi:hypothetical protein
MPYPKTQRQKIKPRNSKQGLYLEERPVLRPIIRGRFWGLFLNREKPIYIEIPIKVI